MKLDDGILFLRFSKKGRFLFKGLEFLGKLLRPSIFHHAFIEKKFSQKVQHQNTKKLYHKIQQREMNQMVSKLLNLTKGKLENFWIKKLKK